MSYPSWNLRRIISSWALLPVIKNAAIHILLCFFCWGTIPKFRVKQKLMLTFPSGNSLWYNMNATSPHFFFSFILRKQCYVRWVLLTDLCTPCSHGTPTEVKCFRDCTDCTFQGLIEALRSCINPIWVCGDFDSVKNRKIKL